jgi:hypothetical protein
MTVTTLRLVVEAIVEDNTALATAILEQVEPEPGVPLWTGHPEPRQWSGGRMSWCPVP